jgi:hypothetical protein
LPSLIAGVNVDALLILRLADQNRAVGQREHRRAPDERRRDDMRARLEQAGMLGKGTGRPGVGHANR